MEIDSLNIKKELQGGKGLIKKIRKEYLPKTIDMAKLAQKRYENVENKFNDIDYALNKLLELEYKIFLEKEKEIIDNFIEYADKIAHANIYPNVRHIIDDYKKSLTEVSKDMDSTKILTGIVNLIIPLAESNRQSRVSRAGSSLMHHIDYLLKKRGFESNKHFQREMKIDKGCKLDFFFPNKNIYDQEPKYCFSVACQTTSNDRFRLSIAQMPKDTINRACTAIGNKNFAKALGSQSLTKEKLQEAKKNNVKFVIFDFAINDKLKKSNTVISYEEWFKDLEFYKNKW